jgi:NADH-quinone oxidoreductase chain G
MYFLFLFMEIWIDNRFFKISNNYTIFQYCAKQGINLPCFCYHERLSIAGNCRICLVEANNALVVSCATLLSDQMKIFTKNKRVKKAREGVLEYLLINHPLDCPICDQGGECDLQDILLTYGSDRGRFYDTYKKSVNNLNNCGPLIRTVMIRCIHCTRCVRFANEVCSVENFGIIGRGFNMEIGTYILNFINDELLANIIDLCPVGALISMPYSFKGRNWEIKYIQSCDILDAVSSSLSIGVAINNVIRILPHIEEFFDEWITSKARFAYDSFNNQRLHYPKIKFSYKFITLSWYLALNIFVLLLRDLNYKMIDVFCGPYLSLELSFTLKFFFNSLGYSSINYFEQQNSLQDLRNNFFLNDTIKNLSNSTEIFIIGCNLRLEAPLINSIFRKNWINDLNFRAYILGLGVNYFTYPVINIGSSIKQLLNFFYAKSLASKYFLFNLYYNINFFTNKNFILFNFIIGSSASIRLDSLSLFEVINFYKNKFFIKNLNIISRHLGRISGLELNLFSQIICKSKRLKLKKVNFLLGLDHINFNITHNLNIFLGFFYLSNFFEYISLIFASQIYVENKFSYLNLEGRFRYTNKIITPFKLVYADHKIIYSIYILTKYYFFYYFSIIKRINIFIIKHFNKLFNRAINNIAHIINYINYYNLNHINYNSNQIYLINIFDNKLSNSLLSKIIYNYYNTDSFCLNSKTMSQMSIKVNYKIFENIK